MSKIKKKRQFTIGKKIINNQSDCFVVAEIGNNHQGELEICKKMFKKAKECGVDGVKLQKRSNKSLYTKDFYHSPYHSENAYGKTYGLHREALEFGKDEYIELKNYAKKLGLVFFSTAFDQQSVDFLENIDIPAYKVASGDLTNIPLLEYIASTGKPMIVSTGGASLHDVRRMYEAVSGINSNLAVLQCTASYPAQFHELDLNVILTYKREFPDSVIGISAHDNGIAIAVASYILGARIVEKHFTLNRAMKGTDHAFSLEPPGMRRMVRDLRRLKLALGDGKKKFYDSEKEPIKKMSKKIVAAKILKKGHVIKKGDLAFKSPGNGLTPNHASYFYGKRIKKTLKRDEALKKSSV